MTEPLMPDLTDGATSSVRRRRSRRPRSDAQTPPADPRGPRAAAALLAALVVIVLIGLLLPAPSTSGGGAIATDPVDSSTAVCPEPGSIDGALTTSAMTVVPGLPGQDQIGRAHV